MNKYKHLKSFLVFGVIVIAISLLFIKSKIDNFENITLYTVTGSYIDPDITIDIHIKDAPKKHHFCLNEQDKAKQKEIYFQNPDYHVESYKMNIFQMILQNCKPEL